MHDLYDITGNRTCEAVLPGIVTKCLNARPKTKQAAIDVCLMYAEIEQHAVVQVREGGTEGGRGMERRDRVAGRGMSEGRAKRGKEGGRERGREGGRERGREGGRERGREGGRERGRKGGTCIGREREGEGEGGKEGGREGGKEREGREESCKRNRGRELSGEETFHSLPALSTGRDH